LAGTRHYSRWDGWPLTKFWNPCWPSKVDEPQITKAASAAFVKFL
jgi:hypothetical protein